MRELERGINMDAVNDAILDNPPNGAWFRREVDRIVVGATTKHTSEAYFMVPVMGVWTLGLLCIFCASKFINGHFDQSILFFLFFLPFGLLFWWFALMTIYGKVEVSIGRDSFVFVGIGRIGWTRRFDWSAVHTIGQADSYLKYPGRRGPAIVMEGTKRVKFATGVDEEQRTFILHVLTSLKAQSRESIEAVERIDP